MFDETDGEPILHYRDWATTGLKDDRGRPLSDGWVLDSLEPDGNGVED
jgi:hypothetical protein